MRDVIVAIDLETTGLDVAEAQILEIGAVKFRGKEILAEYKTLIDPGTTIPAHVSNLTGIRQEDIVGAPKITDVLPTVIDFVGDAPLLGHNIDFDLRFLQKQGIFLDKEAIDTYELASVLLPTAPRYNLNALMQQLALTPDGDYHRALADAMATARLYMALIDKLLNTIPEALIAEIEFLAKGLSWRGQPVFTWANDGSSEKLGDPLEGVFGSFAGLIQTPATSPSIYPLKVDKLAAEMSSPQQVETLTTITDAFNSETHLLVEVPAGFGEKMAYLLPAAEWAIDNHAVVTIATDNEENQRQLLNGPLIAVGEKLGHPVEAVQLKSRSHYLCPSRLAALRRRKPTSVEELRVLGKALIWLYESKQAPHSLDRSHISLRGPAEFNAWSRLSAEDEDCTLERCEIQNHGSCPFYKASRSAANAQLVLVDHTILLSDARSETPVLPPYDRLIIDQANNLEDTLSFGLRFWTDATAIKRRLADLGNLDKGLLGNLIQSTGGIIPVNMFDQIQAWVKMVADAATKMEHHIDRLFETIFTFLKQTENVNNSDFVQSIRITRVSRERSAFGPVKESWGILSQFTETIAIAVEKLSRALAKFRNRFAIPDLEDLIAGTRAAAQYQARIHNQLKSLIVAPDDNIVYWVEISQDSEHLTIQSAPLHTGKLLRQYLWDTKKTAVMVAKSLRIGSSFDYVRARLNAEGDQFREKAIASPLDYKQSILTYLPTDMPEPTERERYQRALEKGIIELASATQGRVLALFTSFTQLRAASENIKARLRLGNITVFDQSDGTSQDALLDGFRHTPNAVLLGSRGFWDSVELTANELAALVIVRLPFGVPADPLIAARSELFDNSFNEFTVPDAILRFRQAATWMLTNRTERGIITVFDKRLTSKEYGKQFLETLSACTIQRGTLGDLGAKASEWLAGNVVRA